METMLSLPEDFVRYKLEETLGDLESATYYACDGEYFNYFPSDYATNRPELASKGYLLSDDRFLMAASAGRIKDLFRVRQHIDNYRLLFHLVDNYVTNFTITKSSPLVFP